MTPNNAAWPIYYAIFQLSIISLSEVIGLFRFGWNYPFTGPNLGVFGEFSP
jgi:hypothetical protein